MICKNLLIEIAIAQEFGMDSVLLNSLPYSQADIQDFRNMYWEFNVISNIADLVTF